MRLVLSTCVLCCLTPGLLRAGYTYAGVAVVSDGVHAWVAARVDDEQVVYQTADFGTTWLACTLNTVRLFSDICFADTLRGWTSGQAGDVQHTTDGGLTWFRQHLGAAKTTSRTRFLDSACGWMVGLNGMQARTTDGGDSWQTCWPPYPPFPQDSTRFRGVALINSNNVWLAGGRIANGDTFLRGQGYIAHSANGGDSWTLNLHDTVNDFYDVAFTDMLKGVVVGGEDSAMTAVALYTSDGGRSWLRAEVQPGTPFLRGVCFVDAAHGWACGDNGTVVRTTDGGRTWGWPRMHPGSSLNDIEFADTLRGMACGDSLVIATTDGGDTWSRTLAIADGGQLAAHGPQPAGTIFRGVLFLPLPASSRQSLAELLDTTGRKVVMLRHGPNDVRHVAPGVYFFRYERSPASRIVITR